MRWTMHGVPCTATCSFSNWLCFTPSSLWGENTEWFEQEPDTGNPSNSLFERYLEMLKGPEIFYYNLSGNESKS